MILNRKRALPCLGAVLFFVGMAVPVCRETMPPYPLWVYFEVSILTFAIYAWDKSAAKNGTRRIRENTLHLFALACGWPGAILAQQLLRHKTQKASFQRLFRVTLCLNCGGLAWFLMPDRVNSMVRFIAAQVSG